MEHFKVTSPSGHTIVEFRPTTKDFRFTCLAHFNHLQIKVGSSTYKQQDDEKDLSKTKKINDIMNEKLNM